MGYSDQEIERDIQAAGKTAPRVKPGDLDQLIRKEHYWHVPGTVMVVCCLELENGFCVIGESAPASRENFDLVIGRKIAKDKARDKVWELEGYLLRHKLWLDEQLPPDAEVTRSPA